MKISWDVISSILNFVGGVILTWDALSVRKIQVEAGARHLQEGLEKEAGLGDLLTYKGRSLSQETTSSSGPQGDPDCGHVSGCWL